ncbi:Snf7 [compost metagenome]
MDIGKVERLQDDMMDLMQDANDFQEVLSRAYDTPDYVDDDELLEELEGLDGDMFADSDASYLDDLSMPSHVPSSGGGGHAVREPQQTRYPAYASGGGYGSSGGGRSNVSQQQLQSLEDELGLL